MKWNKRNSEVKEDNEFCQNCENYLLGNNDNTLNNNIEKLKFLNKISSIFYFLLVLGIFIFIISILFTETYFFALAFLGHFTIIILFYLYNVLLVNLGNVKLINIDEQKKVNTLEGVCTGFALYVFGYSIFVSRNFDVLGMLLTSIALVFFIISIKKVILLKKIEYSEREKISYKKQNIIFGVILGITLFLIPIIPLIKVWIKNMN